MVGAAKPSLCVSNHLSPGIMFCRQKRTLTTFRLHRFRLDDLAHGPPYAPVSWVSHWCLEFRLSTPDLCSTINGNWGRAYTFEDHSLDKGGDVHRSYMGATYLADFPGEVRWADQMLGKCLPTSRGLIAQWVGNLLNSVGTSDCTDEHFLIHVLCQALPLVTWQMCMNLSASRPSY